METCVNENDPLRAWRPPLESESCCALVMSGTLGAACGCIKALRRSERMRDEWQVSCLSGRKCYSFCLATSTQCTPLEKFAWNEEPGDIPGFKAQLLWLDALD